MAIGWVEGRGRCIVLWGRKRLQEPEAYGLLASFVIGFSRWGRVDSELLFDFLGSAPSSVKEERRERAEDEENEDDVMQEESEDESDDAKERRKMRKSRRRRRRWWW